MSSTISCDAVINGPVRNPQIAEFFVQQFIEALGVVLVGQPDGQPDSLHAFNTQGADTFFFQQLAHLLAHPFDGVLDSLVGVHFQNKVHAALKIEAKVDFFMGPYAGLKCRNHINHRSHDYRRNYGESPRKILQRFVPFMIYTPKPQPPCHPGADRRGPGVGTGLCDGGNGAF
jgi:hypothetical protein